MAFRNTKYTAQVDAAMVLDHLETDGVLLAHVIDMVESDIILYSQNNKRKVLGSLRKCPGIYGQSASAIKADPEAFRARWGSGSVKSYPLGYFSSNKAFQNWRSNCFAAFKRAQHFVRPDPKIADVEGWDEMFDVFDSVAEPNKWCPRYPKQTRINLDRVRKIGIRAGLSPWQITQEVLIEARRAAMPGKARTFVTKAAAAFERLRSDPAFEKFMP